MTLKLIHVDTFTDKPFRGNAAAVCILPGPRDTAWMQQVAQEMNLSETAFLYRQPQGFHLRWFTPIVEIDLCGHGTLAAAHVLTEERYIQREEEARFFTGSGVLTARHKGEWIELDFPAMLEQRTDPPVELAKALGVSPQYVGASRSDYLVEVESEETVRALKPDFSLLATIPVHSIIVTAPACSSEYDFVSRVFAPRLGINEDPVTGSAHCCLGPFWRVRLGKDELRAYQASRRGESFVFT